MKRPDHRGPLLSPLGMALLYAIFGTAWITITSNLWTDSVPSAEALAQLELIKGLGFIAVSSVLLYVVLSLYVSGSSANTPSPPSSISLRGETLRLTLVITALLATIPLLALVISVREAPRLEAQAYQELQTIAELKSEQVRSWLDERYSDGLALSRDARFVEQVSLAEDGDDSARQAVRRRLAAVRDIYQYNAASLLDTENRIWLQAGSAHSIDSPTGASNEGTELLDVGQKRITSPTPKAVKQFILDADADGHVHVHLLFDLQHSPEDSTFAKLQLEVQTDRFLFPYISRWSPPNSSGETLLATEHNDHVLFLTPLRHNTAKPGTLTRPLSDSKLPAAVALRSDSEGTFRGQDYRDVEVLAAYHPVAGTNWQLIAKVDRDEVLAPLQTLILWVGAVGLLAVALIGLLVIHNGRQQRALATLRIAAEKRKSDALLQQFFDMPLVGIAVTSLQTRQWLRFNNRLCDILGYTRDELAHKSWADLIHPDDVEAEKAANAKVVRGESDGYNMDVRLLHKNGSVVDTFIDAQCVRSASGKDDYLLSTLQDISERKAAERHLQASHWMLDLSIQQMPIPVIIFSAPNMKVIHLNPASKALMAEQVDDPTQLQIEDYLKYWPAHHPDGTPYTFPELPLYRAVKNSEFIHNEEMVLHLPSGKRWISTNAAPLKDEHGSILAGIVAFPDITEKKQAHRAIEQAQQQAQRYLDIAGVMLLALDVDGNIQLINRRGCEILGRDKDHLLGINWFTHCVPNSKRKDSRTLFEQMISDCIVPSEEIESPVLGHDGKERLVSWRNTLIRNQYGVVTGVLASGEDISDLRHSETRLRTLVDTIPDLIWLKDNDGKFLACNSVFERFFGASEAEIIGKTDYDFVDKTLADFFREQDYKAMMAGEPSTNEETLTFAADGYRGIFETIKTPMRDADGKLIGVLGIARDISERKESNAHLEYLARLYATLSQTNKSILRAKDDKELFYLTCHNTVEYGGFAMAWVGMLDPDTGAISPVSHYGDRNGYLQSLSVSADPVDDQGLGPTGISIREGRPFWCQDFVNSPYTTPWREEARKAGFAASAALPLQRGGRVIGSLNIYAKQTNAFDQQVRELLVEMANEISTSLDRFDREHQRLEMERRLELIIQGSTDTTWDWDLESDQFWDGSNWWNLLGYDAAELPQDSNLWRSLTHPDDVAAVEKEIAHIMESGSSSSSVECRLRHKAGHYVPVLIRGFASHNAQGKVVRLTGTITDLTETKVIEAQLRQQRDELQLAKQQLDSHLEHTPLGVIEWDQEFRIIRWSKRAEDIFGWQEEEVIGRHPSELPLVFIEDSDAVNRVIAQHMTGGLTKSHSTNRNYTRDGKTLYVEWFNSALFDEEGNLVSLLSLAQDVTEQREAERQLRQTEARLRLALSSMPMSIWQMDRELRYSWVYDTQRQNHQTLQPGKVDHQIYNQADADYLTMLKRKVLDTGKALSKEVYLTIDRELRFFSFYIEPLKDEQDLIQGITGVAVDITTLRELQKSQKSLSDALKQSASAIAMLDSQRCFEFTNDAFKALFGYNLEETLGQSVELLAPPAEHEIISESEITEHIHKHRKFEGEVLAKHKDGRTISVYLTAATLNDSEDNIVGYVAQFNDLRPLKHSEERLRDALASTITVISDTLEKRDPYTAGHQHRVAELAVAIAEELGLDANRVEGIRLGSLIHDIGKIYIPAEILTRPGQLSPTEFALMKTHPEVGYEIIKHVQFEWPIADMVYQHHERIDGSGYPQGLQGDEISLEAKIVAVADVVEAMTSHRPYRPGLGLETALAQIEREAGVTLDKDIVDSCLHLFRDKNFDWSSTF